jgi:hypothetical protein
MVVQSRRRRRRAVARRLPPALAIGGLVAVLVVLAAGTISQITPASGTYRRTVDRGYVALASPLAAESDREGSELSSIVSDGASMDRSKFFSALDSVASATSDQLARFEAIAPPYPEGDVGPRCEAALRARDEAVAQIRRAVEALLGGSTGTGAGAGNVAVATSAVEAAGNQIISGDGSWARCRSTLRKEAGNARLPISSWARNRTTFSRPTLDGFVAAVAGSRSLVARPDLGIESAVTVPAPAPTAPGTVEVPPTTSLAVAVVVQDTGNVDEPGIAVSASVTPASAPAGAATASSNGSQKVQGGLEAGGSSAVRISGLKVMPGDSYTLQLSATATDVTSATVSESFQVEQAVSTTTVVSSSSQVAAGEKVTYSATVSATVVGLPAPSGTIAFEDDGNVIPSCGALPLRSTGATCTVSYPSRGTHAVTALYSGDASRSASTSAPLIETVTAQHSSRAKALPAPARAPRSNPRALLAVGSMRVTTGRAGTS